MRVFTMVMVAALALCSVGAYAGETGPDNGGTDGAAPETPAVTEAISDQTIYLFDGRSLNGWRPYVPGDDRGETWSVVNGVIHCKGEPTGYLRTVRLFSNYRLHLEWRWVEEAGNSGVLLHIQPPDTVWPKSIEAQLFHENAGDFYVIGGTSFAEHTDPDTRRVPKKHESNEKPVGQWNSMEILCAGDTIEVYVNGKLQNKATETTVTRGWIGLQSEGVPIEFRNIRLVPLDE